MIDEKIISQIGNALSKNPKIRLAYILGSVVSGRERDDSDFDLAVVVDDVAKISYDQIYQLISHIRLPKDLDLSIVDKKSSPLFLFQIISTGRCVYKRSNEEKVYFESFVMENYYDTAHLRNIYASYLKERFPYAN